MTAGSHLVCRPLHSLWLAVETVGITAPRAWEVGVTAGMGRGALHREPGPKMYIQPDKRVYGFP